MARFSPLALMRLIGPGLLVAATGVGAGDLITAAFTGARLGPTILWAVLVGALLKYVLTEGIARFQLGTGETFLAAALRDLGPVGRGIFGVYLLLWTLVVGSALMSACGVALAGLLGLSPSGWWPRGLGLLASGLGYLLVRRGGFLLFEKVMSVSILVMFVVVLGAALALVGRLEGLTEGLLVPRIPAGGLGWTVSLLGGVGGTLTILCYGYWIREAGRDGPGQLGACRLDLALGYAVTAVFGLGMVVIGAAMKLEGGGQDLLLRLADTLAEALGAWAGPFFLIGALAAVFSSLLGVWEAMPRIADDWWRSLRRAGPPPFDARLPALRIIALLPALGLFFELREVQKTYGILGSLFVPMLALGLLLLGRRGGQGSLSRLGLLAALLFFGWLAWLKFRGS